MRNRFILISKIALLTFISRVSGLVRELVFAKYFGTTKIADVINLSFRMPNLLRRIFAEGAMSSIFIPEFNTLNYKSAKKFSENFSALILLFLTILIILIEIFMPILIHLMAPGFDEKHFALAVSMCRITIPYIIFISLISLIGSILHSLGRFLSFAITSIIMNLCIILGMIFLDKYFAHYSFAISLTFSGILQFVIINYELSQTRFKINYRLIFVNLKKNFLTETKEFQKIFKTSSASIFISGLSQLNIFISQSFASFIPSAVSLIHYGDRINQIFISIIGVTLSTVILPELSSLYKRGNLSKIYQLQNNFLKWGVFLSCPIMIFMIFFSDITVQILFQRGSFNAQDSVNTAQILNIMLIGLVPNILSKILLNIFYALKQLKKLIKLSCFIVITNTILNLMLTKIFGLLGLAYSITLISWINFIILLFIATKNSYLNVSDDTLRFIIKTLFLNVILFCLNFYIKPTLALNDKFLTLVLSFAFEAGLYILISYILGMLNLPK